MPRPIDLSAWTASQNCFRGAREYLDKGDTDTRDALVRCGLIYLGKALGVDIRSARRL